MHKPSSSSDDNSNGKSCKNDTARYILTPHLWTSAKNLNFDRSIEFLFFSFQGKKGARKCFPNVFRKSSEGMAAGKIASSGELFVRGSGNIHPLPS